MKFVDPNHIPSTGNPEIDRDHFQLAEGMNAVYDAWQQGMRCPELTGLLEKLRLLLASHFSKEITIARGAGYESWLAHHQEHKDFLARFTSFIEQCQVAHGPDSISIEMFMELEHHLFEHEVMSDQELWGLWSTEHSPSIDGPLIEWRPEYAVGVEQIDGQHKRLVGVLNEIYAKLQEGKTPRTAITERLRVVMQEAEQHFNSEEQYFSQLPDEMAEQHRSAHASLLAELKRAIEGNELADVDDIKSLIDGYLKFWLLDHILNTDSRLREYLT